MRIAKRRTRGAHRADRSEIEWTLRNRSFDVVVVGGGSGALTSAAIAAAGGLHVLVLEKTAFVGGTTALSGGLLWVPDNAFMRRDGVVDSADDAFEYLQSLIDEDACDTAAGKLRRRALVDNAAGMVDKLTELGVRFRRCPAYPDYHLELPGSSTGRSLEPVPFDRRDLHPLSPSVREQNLIPKRLKVSVSEFNAVSLARRLDRKSLQTMARIGTRSAVAMLRDDSLMVRGEALVGHLLTTCLRLGVTVWTECPVEEIEVESGRVTGVVFGRDSQRHVAGARRGVVLAAGGYARNAEMRRQYARQPSSVEWTSANEGETGEILQAAMRVGAATACLDEAWYSPSSVLPNGRTSLHNPDRTKPHSILVDSSGRRYVNEAADYQHVVKQMYGRNETVAAVPSWLIIDNDHRRSYPFAATPPGHTPRRWLSSGYMKKAATLTELAQQCGIDPSALESTVARFNDMVARGRDEDFGRGDSVYDHYMGDPKNRPNPTLGAIAAAPFYAVRIVPGDIGTNGGLETDQHGQVVDQAGAPIAGLYAVGNIAVTIGGGKNWGAGATIGTAMTSAYIAAIHLTNAR